MANRSGDSICIPYTRCLSAGVVKSFNSSTGLGWIRPEDGGEDLPLRLDLDNQVKSVFPGQKIEYEVEEKTGTEGQATNVKEVVNIKLIKEVVPQWLKLGV